MFIRGGSSEETPESADEPTRQYRSRWGWGELKGKPGQTALVWLAVAAFCLVFGGFGVLAKSERIGIVIFMVPIALVVALAFAVIFLIQRRRARTD